MKINEKIRALRIRSRLTQNQTADFLDVTPVSYTHLTLPTKA